jgi:hypothetical protein
VGRRRFYSAATSASRRRFACTCWSCSLAYSFFFSLFSVSAKGRLKNKRRGTYLPTYFFLRLFEIFTSDFENVFMAFLGFSYAEKRAKNAIKKIEGKRRQEKSFFSQLFRQKAFDMDFPQFCNGIFELPLLRNAQKLDSKTPPKKTHTKTKTKEEGTYLPHLVAICQIYDIRHFQKRS